MNCDITLNDLSELLLNSSLKQYKASTDGTVRVAIENFQAYKCVFSGCNRVVYSIQFFVLSISYKQLWIFNCGGGAPFPFIGF